MNVSREDARLNLIKTCGTEEVWLALGFMLIEQTLHDGLREIVDVLRNQETDRPIFRPSPMIEKLRSLPNTEDERSPDGHP